MLTWLRASNFLLKIIECRQIMINTIKMTLKSPHNANSILHTLSINNSVSTHPKIKPLKKSHISRNDQRQATLGSFSPVALANFDLVFRRSTYNDCVRRPMFYFFLLRWLIFFS